MEAPQKKIIKEKNQGIKKQSKSMNIIVEYCCCCCTFQIKLKEQGNKYDLIWFHVFFSKRT